MTYLTYSIYDINYSDSETEKNNDYIKLHDF